MQRADERPRAGSSAPDSVARDGITATPRAGPPRAAAAPRDRA
jgi:hypothetical protein